MKRLVIPLLFLAAFPLWASDVYVAQFAVGGNTGANCANARAMSSLTSGDWVAGNTLHLCGTINVTAGAAGLVAQGSGTSGSPIIVQFEANAILQSTYLGGTPSPGSCYSPSTCLAGIESYSFSNIIIDGGTNGIIQNTANGTNLANHQPSSGVTINGGSNFIVRNLTIRNLYINDPTSNDAAGEFTTNVLLTNSTTNVAVCNNTLTNSRLGIGVYASGGVAPTYPSPSCASNAFTAGTNLFGNTLVDHAWQIQPTGTSSPIVNIFNNDISSTSNWIEPGNYFHTDGVIAWGDIGVQITVFLFNNSFHDTSYGTAAFYCTYGQAGSGCRSYVFNNIFSAPANTNIPVRFMADSGFLLGPHYVFNNTFVNNFAMVMIAGDNASVSIEDNLVLEGPADGYFYSKPNGANTLSSVLSTADYNSFYGGRGFSFQGGGYWCWPQSGGSPSGCSSDFSGPWVNTGFDTHSISGNPLLDANYRPTSSSPVIGAGTNLTSLCSTIAPLCYDKDGNARPSSGPWTIGAYQYATSGAGGSYGNGTGNGFKR